MTSMYDTIMELPLFKGISIDQVSLFLEKTSVEFLNFNEGELIVNPESKVSSIDFILKGNVLISYSLRALGICVEDLATEGRVIGALRLFGLNTEYSCKAIAKDKVSLMRIGKEQYFNLLFTDRIYVLNLLNYLSAAAQKPIDRLMDLQDLSIYNRLKTLSSVFSVTNSQSVTINGSDESLAKFCGCPTKDFIVWKENEVKEGKITVYPGKIKL